MIAIAQKVMNKKILEEDLEVITSASLPWENFRNSTVLISGANGFLPAYMVETLLYLNTVRGLNIEIVGLVRNKEKALVRFSQHKERNDLTFIVQDVCEPINCVDKIDYIVHAASQASPKFYGTDPVGTLSANTLGTHNLLQLARKNDVKSFLYFSSSDVYGQVDDSQIPTKENQYGYLDPTNLRSCYAESKRMGETMCVSWFNQYSVLTKIVRPFHTYGPGMTLDDGRVYADFIANIVHNKDIVMNSDGTAIRAFCYLADAVRGFFTVLVKGENGQAYNIGNPQCETSILDLATQLVNLFPEKGLTVVKKEISNQEYIKSSISRNSPDISKIKELGWQPSTPIEIGFKRTLESFS
ncbi:MAG: NAD-dependent epimerase/dehydratase family protein [Snowella sp.]|nr:NAD-dependent epimerase/dehydratase family protein [Snowella sp.]